MHSIATVLRQPGNTLRDGKEQLKKNLGNILGGEREWRSGDTGQATGPQSSETQKREYPQSRVHFRFLANDSPILSPLTHSVQGTNFGKILLPFDQNEGPQSSNDQVSVMSEGGILESDCLWSM